MQRGHLEATFWGGAAVVLATLVGCGSGTSGGSSPGGSVPESEVGDRMVTAYCEGLRICCQSRGFSFNAAGCDAALRQQLTPSGPVCAPGSTYSAEIAGTCVQQAQSYAANCGSTPKPTACERICVGTVALGGACESEVQCAQPASGQVECDFTLGSGSGTCALVVRGQLGQGCQGSCSLNGDCAIAIPLPAGDAGTPGATSVPGDAICYVEDGLYCANDWTCQRFVAVGGACTDAESCVSGAYCGTAGVCETLKAAGAPCTSYAECLGGCDAATGTCVSDTGDFGVTAEVCAGNFGGSSDDTTPPASVPPATPADAG